MFDEANASDNFFMPLKRVHEVIDRPEGPEDWSDIAIMEFDKDLLTREQINSP